MTKLVLALMLAATAYGASTPKPRTKPKVKAKVVKVVKPLKKDSLWNIIRRKAGLTR